MNEYKNNQQPKVGDIVRFKSDEDKSLYRVTAVQGGRLGNKVCVKPVDNPNTFVEREYYYYCFEVVTPVNRTSVSELVALEENFCAAAKQLYKRGLTEKGLQGLLQIALDEVA